jgi:cytochrome b561
MRFATAKPRDFAAQKHHWLTITLHWATVLCIVLAVASVLLREMVEDKFWRQALLETHRQLGMVVLLGVAIRLGVRMRYGMADHMRGLPWPMRMAAQGAHWCLYGLLVAIPLLGWATTNAHNLQLRFAGLIELPALVGVDSEFADELSDNHVLASWALLALVVVHAAAALYHHYVRRDLVFWAMLPGASDLPSPEGPLQPVRTPEAARGDAGSLG